MTKHKPRPTVYKGIQMRSRLEAGFAAWLDGRFIKWHYEPCAFADERGQYLPDFELLEFDVASAGPRHDQQRFIAPFNGGLKVSDTEAAVREHV